MKKRVLFGMIATLVTASIAGCNGKPVDMTKEDGVTDYDEKGYNNKDGQYEIDVMQYISVKYVGPDQCGTYEVDSTKLEDYILSHTVHVDGTKEAEALRKRINASFEVYPVKLKNQYTSSSGKGYLCNGDTIMVKYVGNSQFYITKDEWLKHSSISVNNEIIEKEFKVSGLGELTDEMIWEGVGYGFAQSWLRSRIMLNVDNDLHAISYKMTIEDEYDFEEGQEFEIIARLNGEEIGRKTFVIKGSPQ